MAFTKGVYCRRPSHRWLTVDGLYKGGLLSKAFIKGVDSRWPSQRGSTVDGLHKGGILSMAFIKGASIRLLKKGGRISAATSPNNNLFTL